MTEQTQPTDAEIEDAVKHLGAAMLSPVEVARAVLAKWGTPAGAGGDRMADSTRRMIEGMSVSIDVSTGDHDAGRRYFGTVTEVMDCNGDKHGVTLLVQDAEPNFTPQPTQAQAGAVPMSEKFLQMMTPAKAEPSDFAAGVRFAEAHHGIKGADHA